MAKKNIDTKKAASTKEVVSRINNIFGNKATHGLNPKVRGLIYGLLVVVIFGAFYYFLYTSENKKAFDRKRFRSLKTLSDNLVDRYSELYEIIDRSENLDQDIKDGKINLIVLDNTHELLQKSVEQSSLLIKIESGNYYYLPFQDLFKSIIPSALFKYFVIFKNDSILFQNVENGFKKFKSDTLKNRIFHSNGINDFDIAGLSYRAYTHSFKFSAAQKALFNKVQNPAENGLKPIRKIIASISGDWTVLAFVPQDTFTREITRVNIWFIIILTIVIFIIMACLPLLKLLLAGEVELIKARDAFLATVSIFLGTPLVFVVIFSLFEYLDFYTEESENNLEYYNAEITEEFESEVDSLTSLLDRFDSVFSKFEGDFGHSSKGIKGYSGGLVAYPYYNEATLINTRKPKHDLGEQLIQFVPGEKDTKDRLSNFKERDYYKRADKGRLWNNNGKEIYIESVVSWLTGLREAVISKKSVSHEPHVLAISSNLGSVFDVILPRPYFFSIIDGDGEVLFHSIETRNVNENFLDELELSEKRLLRAHMKSGQSTFFGSTYWGDRIRGFMKPMDHLPLYVITYYEMNDTRLFISEVMSTTLIYFLIGIFGLACLSVVTYSIVKIKCRFLKIKIYAYQWVRPESDKQQKYSLLINAFVVISLVLIARLLWSGTYPASYALEICIPAISFYFVFNILGPWSDDKSQEIKLLIQTLVLVLIEFSIFWVLEEVNLYSLLVIVLTIILGASFLTKKNWSNKIKFRLEGPLLRWMYKAAAEEEDNQIEYMNTYKVFVLVWILSSFILPITVIFFKANIDQEVLWNRFVQLNQAQDFTSKMDKAMNEKFKDFQPESLKELLIQNTIIKGNYDFHLKDKSQFNAFEYDQRPINWRKAFRPFYGETSYYLSALLVDIDPDKSGKQFHSTWYSVGNTHYLQYANLHSTLPNYDLFEVNDVLNVGFHPQSELAVVFVIVCVLLVVTLWFLISSVLDALFAFKYYHISKHSSHPNIETIFNKDDKDIIYIVLSPGRSMDITVDAEKIELKLGATTQKIEDILEQLSDVRSSNKKAILLSYYYPSFILLNYLKVLKAGKKEGLIEELVREFGKIPQYIFGYSEDTKKSSSNEFLSNYLSKSTFKELETHEKLIISENEIMKDESIGFSHFYHLWHTLSDREKYSLYDLSIDGFLNTKSTKAITNLMYKGIIYWKDGLRVFHPAFRNFILANVAKDYGKQLVKEIGKKSTWASLSVVIYILILAALFFVAFSEPAFFSDFNTFITVAAGIVTVVPTVASLFAKGEE